MKKVKVIYMAKKKKIETSKFTPFSKKNVIYARIEAYVFSAIFIILVFLDKDVSAIAILLTLAWGGYKGIQCLYLKCAEREHLEEIRCGRLRENLDLSDVDEDIDETENKNILEFLEE